MRVGTRGRCNEGRARARHGNRSGAPRCGAARCERGRAPWPRYRVGKGACCACESASSAHQGAWTSLVMTVSFFDGGYKKRTFLRRPVSSGYLRGRPITASDNKLHTSCASMRSARRAPPLHRRRRGEHSHPHAVKATPRALVVARFSPPPQLLPRLPLLSRHLQIRCCHLALARASVFRAAAWRRPHENSRSSRSWVERLHASEADGQPRSSRLSLCCCPGCLCNAHRSTCSR